MKYTMITIVVLKYITLDISDKINKLLKFKLINIFKNYINQIIIIII
jgi:hypothetical protein